MFSLLGFPSISHYSFDSPERKEINNTNSYNSMSISKTFNEVHRINFFSLSSVLIQNNIINSYLDLNSYGKLACTSKKLQLIVIQTLNSWDTQEMILTPKLCYSYKKFCQSKFEHINTPKKPLNKIPPFSLYSIFNFGNSIFNSLYSIVSVEPQKLPTLEETKIIEENQKKTFECYVNAIKKAKGFDLNQEYLWFNSDEFFGVQFDSLKLLKLDGFPLNVSAFHSFLRSHTRIQNYSINFMPLQDLSLKSLNELTDNSITIIAIHCLFLQKLDLEGANQLTDLSITFLSKNCIRLKYLNLNLIPKLTDQSITSIANNCSNLISLKIMGNIHITNDALYSLGQNTKLLEIIDLRSTRNITDDGIISLALCCQNLKEIYLAQMRQLTNISLKSLARYSSKLEIIDLTGLYKINISGLEALFKYNKNLKKIRLNKLDSLENEILQQINLKIKIEYYQ